MEYNSPKFRKWLDKLQRESWQLELIISGFAIYGLITALEPIETKLAITASSDLPQLASIWLIALLCCQILIFNMLVHVLLRGLWIGAIGLRYVSGDIDYDKLNYSDKFTQYLQRKVGSFDKYIARLENYCSIIFAISFLLVFYVIGFFTVLIALTIVINGLEFIDIIPVNFLEHVQNTILILVLAGASLTFLDFIGQGFLKKKKWTARLFFPIYWVFSKLTLSFLYRPLAYNFLDNRLGKWLSLLLVPIYVIIIILSGVTYQNSNYLLFLKDSSEYYTSISNYEDELEKPTQFVNFASIPSKIIRDPFLKVFMVYSEVKEDFVFEKIKELRPENDQRGLSLAGTVGFKVSQSNEAEDTKVRDSILPKYIEAINQLYSLNIDGVMYESDFIFSNNQNEKIGFETYLKIRNLSEGKHLLTITGPMQKTKNNEKETEITTLATIPFWYFPENPSQAPIVTKTTEEQAATALETLTTKTN